MRVNITVLRNLEFHKDLLHIYDKNLAPLHLMIFLHLWLAECASRLPSGKITTVGIVVQIPRTRAPSHLERRPLFQSLWRAVSRSIQ